MPEVKPLDDKNSEVFETFRQYWNSCEEMKLAPEYGRIYAIFKSAALPSQRRSEEAVAALAIEYEAKTITADRFSERVCQLLKYHVGESK